MPRDSNGNMTLPVGNPVVAEQTIGVDWANPTMDDLAAEIQDSLSRSGKGGMSVALKGADAGYVFDAEQNSGLYRTGAGDVRAKVLGVDALFLTNTGISPLVLNSIEIAANNPVGTYLFNSAINAIDSTGAAIVGGGSAGQPNLIGSPTKPAGTAFTPIGWSDDTGYVAGTATQAIIAAGGDNICNQSAGSISGGAHNFIKYDAGGHSSVGSGVYNVIAAQRCFIASGIANTCTGGASTSLSFIGNGFNNNLVGNYSAILNGQDCNVNGDYSFAFGRNAKANANGVTIFKDDVVTDFEVTQAQQFAARFANGYRFTTGNVNICDSINQLEPQKRLHIYTELSAQIVAGNALLRLQGVGPEGGEVGMDFIAPFSTGSSNRAGRVYGVFDGASFTAARLTFQSITTGDVLVDTLSLKNGQVGVGVTSPPAKFAVDGTVNFANLPTANPGGTGNVWNDSGTLKIT